MMIGLVKKAHQIHGLLIVLIRQVDFRLDPSPR